MLADAEGVALDRRGHAGDDSDFEAAGLWTGTAWSEARLLSLGYAFEQLTQVRHAPTFPASVNGSPAFDR